MDVPECNASSVGGETAGQGERQLRNWERGHGNRGRQTDSGVCHSVEEIRASVQRPAPKTSSQASRPRRWPLAGHLGHLAGMDGSLFEPSRPCIKGGN